MSKALASIGTGPHAHLLRLAARSFRPFARRHGYELELRTSGVDESRPTSWARVPFLRDLLGRYDVVAWIDADAVVVNPTRDIADELAEDRFLGLVRHHTTEGDVPNAGVLVLRSCPEAIAFLDEVWAQEDLIHHRWWENAAICRLLGYELEPETRLVAPTPLLRDHATFLDPRWNSIPDSPAPGAWIRHYPGYRWQVRAAFMARDLVASRLDPRLRRPT